MTLATTHNGRFSGAEVAAYEAGKAFEYPADEEGLDCVEAFCWDEGYDSEHFICGFYSRADGPTPDKYDGAYYEPDCDE